MAIEVTEDDYYEIILRSEETIIEEVDAREEFNEFRSTLTELRRASSDLEAKKKELQHRISVLKGGTWGSGVIEMAMSAASQAESTRSKKAEEEMLAVQRDDVHQQLVQYNSERKLLEEQTADAKARIEAIVQEREQLKKATSKHDGQMEEEYHKKKAALWRLALDCDPKAARCAAALGQLMLRTPHYAAETFCEHIRSQKRKPIGRFDEEIELEMASVLSSDSFELRSQVSELVDQARRQDHRAILELLAWLISSQVPDVVQNFLESASTQVAQETELRDSDFITREQGRMISVTALWPPVSGGPTPTHIPDKDIATPQFYSELAGHILGCENELTGESGPMMSVAEVLEDVKISTRPYHLTTLVGRIPGAGNAEIIMIGKALIEASYLRAAKADRHLEMTPHVVACLRCIVRRIAQEVSVLRHRLDERKLMHWYVREEALRRTSVLAKKGSIKAIDLMLEVMHNDRHWAMRKSAATMMLWVIASVDAEELLTKAVEKSLSMMFLTDSQLASMEVPVENAEHIATTIRESVKEAFLANYAKWPTKVRHKVSQELYTQIEADPSQGKQLEILMEKLGSSTLPAPKKDDNLRRLRNQFAEEEKRTRKQMLASSQQGSSPVYR